MSAVLTAEQEAQVQKAKARAEELMKLASDNSIDPVLRIEAQNKLNGMALQGLTAQSGIGSGLKDILKAAAPQLERAEQAYREILSSVGQVESRVARLETNMATYLKARGIEYK